MRAIFRKLDRRQTLEPAEYARLMDYAEQIGRKSAQSYQVFYQQYAQVLEDDYSTYLPRFWYGIDDFVNYLIENKSRLSEIIEDCVSWERFPLELQPYLKSTFRHGQERQYFLELANWLGSYNEGIFSLPKPRQGKAVIIYEDGNPFKEPGLKVHFDRLSRYTFITRLQSYRYLTRNKAHHDRIEVLAPDRLGGTYTMKDKSLYYFIYLTEEDPARAENACQVLNYIMGVLTH